MKYIIELEDEPMIANSYHQKVDELWKAKGFNSLVFDKYGLNKLTPYTEPDRKAIEDKVWNFASDCFWSMTQEEIDQCYDGWFPKSYQEAKSKYDLWAKSKEEIHVGDELEQITASGNPVGLKCVVTKIVDDEILKGIAQTGEVVTCSSQIKRWWRKTGRHFDEVEKLLERMREEFI